MSYRHGRRPVPEGEDKERAELQAELATIAATATEEELLAIAGADYGANVKQHLAALQQVVFAQACRMTAAQFWYPSEVVELTAYVPSGRPFAIATAVLMVNALENEDAGQRMEFLWDSNAAAYLALPTAFWAPVLGGFRWLADHAKGFCPKLIDDIPSRDAVIAWRIEHRTSG